MLGANHHISGICAMSEVEAHGGRTEESVFGEAYCSRHVQSHLAVPDGQNPRNLSGAANYPGQWVGLRRKKIQNSGNFIWDSRGSGRVRSGTERCDCKS